MHGLDRAGDVVARDQRDRRGPALQRFAAIAIECDDRRVALRVVVAQQRGMRVFRRLAKRQIGRAHV